MRIITGFQTGIDIAAARAALAVGLVASYDLSGAMPKGFLTLEGPRPDYADLYGAFEIPSTKWDDRTRRNVQDAAATFIFASDPNSRGTQCAANACKRLGKPCHIVLLRFPASVGPVQMGIEGRPVSVADIAGLMKPCASINIGGNRDVWLEEKMEPVFIFMFNLAVYGSALGAKQQEGGAE